MSTFTGENKHCNKCKHHDYAKSRILIRHLFGCTSHNHIKPGGMKQHEKPDSMADVEQCPPQDRLKYRIRLVHLTKSFDIGTYFFRV